MRYFFQQQPGKAIAGFDLRLLPGFAAFFSASGQNLNLTIGHLRTLTLINRVF
ncbi:hypothetical protein QUA13_21960 [Microcoleus sp. S28C3]|uniref:hypothetical protein n=1 Tax=Microcoleus sp. S28C3 TaxID=3055414 RepID=UPI002FCE9022